MILYRKGLLARAMRTLEIKELHAWQAPVFKDILAFRDVLYTAPTGQGKSVLFQLPAVMEGGEHLTIVVSPMLALRTIRQGLDEVTDHAVAGPERIPRLYQHVGLIQHHTADIAVPECFSQIPTG